MTDFDEKIAIQEAAAEKALKRAARMRTIQLAESEIPSVWDTGQVTQTSLAQTYGITPTTVKRILRDSGRSVTRVKKLSYEERAEVGALIRQNVQIPAIAAQFNVSVNTIRRTGLDLGILKKGERRPRRSDAEYQVIKDYDADTRIRFGTGLYNLGLGLRTWENKKRAEARAANASIPDPTPAELDQHNPDDQIEPPAEQPAPVVQTWTPSVVPSEPQPVDDIPPREEDPDTQLGGNDNPPDPAPETEVSPFRSF